MGRVTYFTIDKFEIARALRVTISSTEFRSGFVGGKSRHSTVFIHGYEVERTVQALVKKSVIARIYQRIMKADIRSIQLFGELQSIMYSRDLRKVNSIHPHRT
jgi:hypothetical protein